MSVARKKRIGELLVEEGLVTEDQLAEGLRLQSTQGCKIVEALIALGHLDAPNFARFLSKQGGMPSIDISRYEISKDIVNLVPRDFAVKHEVFPIDKMSSLLTLGMVCPLDSTAISELEQITGLRVKPILCGAEDIRAAIRRYHGEPQPEQKDIEPSVAAEQEASLLESTLRLAGVAALIRNINSLPVMSRTAQRMNEAMGSGESSAKDFADIIAEEPGLAARVLSVANSAAYGLQNRVDDLALAVSLMGLDEVYAIVLSASVLDNAEKSGLFDYRSFMVDSLCCSMAARAITRGKLKERASGAFCAGLLHDVGQLALVQVAPNNYGKLNPFLRGLELIAAEEEVVGLSHAEAGYELARAWNLPDHIANSIRYHHAPERCPEECPTAVIVAICCKMVEAAEDGIEDVDHVVADCAGLLDQIGIASETAEGLYQWLSVLVPTTSREIS